MAATETNLYTLNQVEFETLEHGVQRGWAQNRQIVIFIVPSLQREVLDVWAANVIQTANSWPKEKPILILHDMSAFGNLAAVTPYVRKKSEEIAAASPYIRGRGAVVMSNTLFLRAISLFVNYLNRSQQPNMEIRVLTDLKQAWYWLTAALPKP